MMEHYQHGSNSAKYLNPNIPVSFRHLLSPFGPLSCVRHVGLLPRSGYTERPPGRDELLLVQFMLTASRLLIFANASLRQFPNDKGQLVLRPAWLRERA